MQMAATKGSRARDIVCSLVLGFVLGATSAGSLATVGVREMSFLANSSQQTLIIAGAGIGIGLMMAAFCYVLLRNAERLITWADRKRPLRAIPLSFDGKGIAIATAIILVCWIPWIILQFPTAMNGDTYNQLYQFQTSAPTLYSTERVMVDESFVDHHPVFDTLVYGAFLALGDALGSQNAGLFAFSLLQCALIAFSLALTCCYLEKLGVPKLFRIISLAFCALFPPLPLWAMTMVKDTTNTCTFIFFCLIVAEAVRTRGQSFDSKAMVAAYIIVAILCILTKKSGALVVVAATIALMLYVRSRWLALALGLVVPLVVCFALVPATVYPLIGGVAPGGKQEAFGFALQQVVTAINEGDELAEWERDAVSKVLNIEKACKNYKPNIADPVKNSALDDATTADYLAFIPAYLSIGVRNIGPYTASVFQIAGVQITPGRTFTYVSTPMQTDEWVALFEEADTKGELHLTYTKPEPIASASEAFETWWRESVPKLGPFQAFINAGFYGGWIPLLCLVICLFKGRRYAVALVPMVAVIAIIFMSPASSVRYILPLAFTAPLMLGLLCAALRPPRTARRAPAHAR